MSSSGLYGPMNNALHSQFKSALTESAWVSVFVLFILYLCAIICAPFFQKYRAEKNAPLQEPKPQGSSTETPTQEPVVETENELVFNVYQDLLMMGNFIKNSEMGWALKDSFLLVLATVLVTLGGYGFTGGALVLVWISFGLLILWSFSTLIRESLLACLLDFVMIFVSGVLLIITWAIAFRE